MEIQEFLMSLNIEKEIVIDNGEQTVFLDSSDEYARVYTALTESEEVDLESESVVVSSELISLKFSNNDFVIALSADLTRDIYKVTIEETL